jgi:hypothetical protein
MSILKNAVGVECCEISIGCVTDVGANSFACKRLIMRINSHLQSRECRGDDWVTNFPITFGYARRSDGALAGLGRRAEKR